MFDKPFSQACENNKQPILDILSRVLEHKKILLEIGSGTGQHAAYFAPRLMHLEWHTSDMPDKHLGIAAWLADMKVDNLHSPLAFTIGDTSTWPLVNVDAVYTANTTHIMQPSDTKLMMKLVANNLLSGGVFCQYGPYNFQGQYSSESNQSFDQHLSEQGCGGIRDIDELILWANPLILIKTISMPANNFMLIWQKQ
ncbi:MAG: trans-aconitate methyltransferase [Paraglaciecola sp.]|jgi:trans-aconitate methyltransferase